MEPVAGEFPTAGSFIVFGLILVAATIWLGWWLRRLNDRHHGRRS